MVAEAAEALGGLDVLINNAGNVRAAPLEDIDVADIRAMVALNLLAPVLTTRAAPMMATTRAGADLGYGLRPVDEVVAEIVAGLEQRRIDINTQLPERRAMQELNARDPLAVDAALAPQLAELRAAVSTHRSI
ncbi:hypothetical protein DV20_29275 [Amycolatopsis rifamycinica]|uniref:Uncharacterized protein n=1 Tax=Amycolatopsis rifamycinica TaxID=287986 RepID=A0A066TU77_9PSEU|nr:hypothetical protein DV20_29275 [Amycolatopsis rifamycinica]